MELIEQPVLDATPYYLRPFSLQDIPLIKQASTDPYITKITTVPLQGDHQQCLEFIYRQWSRTTDGTGYSFAIADSTTHRAVGQIGLWFRDARHGRASIGYWVGPEHRRQGIAACALNTLADWALDYPGIHRVRALRRAVERRLLACGQAQRVPARRVVARLGADRQ
ncbi:GNAT family N-acetyltransferase [Glutamicibacter sp. TV12E]|uniref:GNAT family N-acetyltransferase n=1 Tax=Glutamicibacter sp. TV12E TaxID=3446362 RepID=UPI004033B5BB